MMFAKATYRLVSATAVSGFAECWEGLHSAGRIDADLYDFHGKSVLVSRGLPQTEK